MTATEPHCNGFLSEVDRTGRFRYGNIRKVGKDQIQKIFSCADFGKILS